MCVRLALSIAVYGFVLIGGAHAATVELRGVKIELPAGWATAPSAHPESLVLRSQRGAITVTFSVLSHWASADPDIKQVADGFAATSMDAMQRISREQGMVVKENSSKVAKEDGKWVVRSSAQTEKFGVRAVTIFDAKRAITVGADSRTATQAEMDEALRQIVSGIR